MKTINNSKIANTLGIHIDELFLRDTCWKNYKPKLCKQVCLTSLEHDHNIKSPQFSHSMFSFEVSILLMSLMDQQSEYKLYFSSKYRSKSEIYKIVIFFFHIWFFKYENYIGFRLPGYFIQTFINRVINI